MEREFVRHAADQAVVDRDPTPSPTLVFKGCEEFRRFRTALGHFERNRDFAPTTVFRVVEQGAIGQLIYSRRLAHVRLYLPH